MRVIKFNPFNYDQFNYYKTPDALGSQLMSDRCIIITGTVIPNVKIFEPETPQIRRKQYLDVMSYYQKKFSEPIYFLENSGYDFSNDDEFNRLFENGIQLIKFPVSNKIYEGKGYQEFQMIDQFIRESSSDYSSFVKITGRYKFHNIQNLIDISHNGLVIDIYRRYKWAVTNIFCSTYDFYQKYLLNLYSEVDDSHGRSIERRIYKKISNNDLWKSIQIFPRSPIYTIPFSKRENFENWRILLNTATNIERKIINKFSLKQIFI